MGGTGSLQRARSGRGRRRAAAGSGARPALPAGRLPLRL